MAIRIGNATSATAPMPSASHATGSRHSRSPPRITPNDRPPTATAATNEPSQSNRRRASRSRDSSTWRSVIASATARIGTLTRNAIRQPIESTSRPPATGPISASADVAAAQIPNARPRSGPSNVCVMIDSAPGTSSAPAAPWSSRKTTSASSVGASPHRPEVRAERRQADAVDPPPAVAIGQGPGQDQQGREDRQVAADDVGLALEDAEHRGRQLAADPRQGDVDDGAVEEHGTGPDDRRDQGPALARRHAAQCRR